MFKILAVVACLAVVTLAATIPDKNEKYIIEILKSETIKNEDGSYDVVYEGADGTARHEKAIVVDAGTEDETLEVKGSYKYINEDGEEVEVFYTAGRNGFVPYGSIINAEISAAAEAAKDLPREYDEKMKKHFSSSKVVNKEDN